MAEAEIKAKKIARALHPPRCPKCGAELDMLINVCEAIEAYYFYLDENGDAVYESKDAWAGDWSEYQCPECDETLFTSEEMAKKFLEGDFEED